MLSIDKAINNINSKKAEYKSAIRSRKLIREAFLEVLERKHLEKITVSDIVKQADINRSTFYAHYSCPHDVITQIASDLVEEINSLFVDFKFSEFLEQPSKIITSFCEYLELNKEMHKKLVYMQGVPLFLVKINELIRSKILEDETVPKSLKADERFLVAIDFFINGIIYSFRDQIAGNLNVKLESLAQMMSYFISQNLESFKEYSRKNCVD